MTPCVGICYYQKLMEAERELRRLEEEEAAMEEKEEELARVMAAKEAEAVPAPDAARVRNSLGKKHNVCFCFCFVVVVAAAVVVSNAAAVEK